VSAPYPRAPELRFAPEFAELTARVAAILRADRTGAPIASGEFRQTAEVVDETGAEVST
jgi:hypothetical protein